jgi:hypothetical protein
MILATRIFQRGLDERRPITEALQLRFRVSSEPWVTMIRTMMSGGASVEETLELWAS